MPNLDDKFSGCQLLPKSVIPVKDCGAQFRLPRFTGLFLFYLLLGKVTDKRDGKQFNSEIFLSKRKEY